METKNWAIALIISSTLLNTVAQLLYKLGADRLSFNLIAIITNYFIICGLILYAISAVIMITAFRGGELSVLYPLFATSYIWVVVASFYVLDEVPNLFKIFGIVLIIMGISFIGIGSKDKAMRYAGAV